MLYQTENPHGGDLYGRTVSLDFSANTNPLGTPPAVRQAVIDAAELLNQYPDPYCRALVAALADFEQVPESWILCGCGAAELIFSFCAAVKPRRALELAPTFSEYATALEAMGAAVGRYPLEAVNDFSLTDDFLSFLGAGQWDALFLCNPNNPTGQTIPHPLLEEILDLCQKKRMRLFVDECFLDLTDGGRDLSLKPFLRDHPELFILKAFTKSYGMAGLRLGYCLSADSELLRAMGRTVQPWNVSLPAQAAGVAALGEREFLRRTRAVIHEERAWLQEHLAELGLRVFPSQANYLLVKGPAHLCEKLLERGILARSCANYHGLGPEYLRLAVKRHEENETLIAILQDIGKEG